MISLNGPCEDITLERRLLFLQQKVNAMLQKIVSIFTLYCRETYSCMAICFNWKVLWGIALLRIHGTTEYIEKKKKIKESKDDKEKLVSFKKCLLSLGCHVLLVK